MRFSSTAVFWLLFNASASAFATQRNFQSSSSLNNPPKGSSTTSSNLPFIYKSRGGDVSDSSTRLFATVDKTVSSPVSQANLDLLSERGQLAISKLIESDVGGYQSHVYGDWPEPGTQDDDKRRLAEQVRTVAL